MKKRLTIKYIVWDTLSALVAWGALFVFRKAALEGMGMREVWGQVVTDGNFWAGLVLVPMGWITLYTIQGTYRNVLRKARLKELLDTLTATVTGVVVIFFLLLLDDQFVSYRYHYATFLFLLAVHFTLTYIPRLIITTHTVRGVHTRRVGFPTLMVGEGPQALKTYLEMENQEVYSGNLFVGSVAISSTHSALDGIMPSLGGMGDLRTIVKEHGIEEAVIAAEPQELEGINSIIQAVAACDDIIIKITPSTLPFYAGRIHQDNIFHSPLIVINNRLMPEWQYSLKRLFDILVSAIAMVLLSPVYLITAIIVKATSPGPVFYAQERIGYMGRPFKMHKFRSMYVDAEDAGPALSKDDDPRITPFGRFMRKVRLDEIPQFYNVLRGTMSLVGPRPERQYYIDQILLRAPEYQLLHRVKPGITSWGQVKYGYASSVDEMVERLRYDLLYLDNMSLTTDLKILLYTVIIILQGRGK